MNPIALDLGIIQIHWYSLTMLLAMLVGGLLFYKTMIKEKISEEKITDLIFYTLIWAIIGARLYYVFFNITYYIKNPLEIIEIWNGGLAIHGGILAGGLYIIRFAKKNKLNFLKIFDIASPSLIIAQAIGRWGNFFNQEAHGPVTTIKTLKDLLIPNFIIKGMKINNNYYHPTFYYECLWNLLGFIILIFIRKKKKLRTGQLTGIYMIWYSVARFLIESLRTDSLMLGNIKIAQFISIIMILIGIYLIVRKPKNRVSRNKERYEEYED